MSTMNLLDEKHITNALVFLDRKQLNIVFLSLEQEFGKHHEFTIVLGHDGFSKNFFGKPSEQIELMGKMLHVELQQGNNNGGAYEFRGIINEVYTEGSEGMHGRLVLKGKSPTCLLDRGKRLDVFSDMGLERIVDDICDNIPYQRLSVYNHPDYAARLPFLMQYYESDWEFLQRLSAISGEALYYTGWDLVFGRHKDWPEFKVVYDRELSQVQFGTRLLANTFVNYLYLAEKDETYRTESPSGVENSNRHLDQAAEKGLELIANHPPLLPPDLNVGDKGSLNEMVERRKTATATRTVYVKGVSKTCDPRIGRLLTISMPENMPGAKDLGTYRIVKVKHVIDENHRYRCEFEGVPASLKYFPVPGLKMPVAASLVGTVLHNNDPAGLGRVCVEFPFAQDRYSETWMRVMSPDAGGLVGYGSRKEGVVEKNRGFVFIPEEGDQVMVGFEFGDPNRPYVMGSMFHGKNTTGSGEGNHIKSIITRSGHTIEFDDAEETLGITIKDENGNRIRLDSKGKNIEITAPETLKIKAKNIIVEAEEDMKTSIGQDMKHVIKRDFSLDSGKKTIIASGDNTEISANRELDIYGKKRLIAFTDGDSEIGSQNQMHLYGGNSLITAKDKIEQKAPDINELPQSGEFIYNKEKQIIDIKWMNEDMTEEIFEVEKYQKIVMLVQTRNYEEGEPVSLKIDFYNDNGETEKTQKLDSFVRNDGFAIFIYEII